MGSSISGLKRSKSEKGASEVSEYSKKTPDGLYWTDHTTMALSPQEIGDLGELTIVSIDWCYEDRGMFKHSYIVFEAAKIDGAPPLFFASEKNDLGVIWFNLPSPKSDIKIEHDGREIIRKKVFKHNTCKAETKLKTLKAWSRN